MSSLQAFDHALCLRDGCVQFGTACAEEFPLALQFSVRFQSFTLLLNLCVLQPLLAGGALVLSLFLLVLLVGVCCSHDGQITPGISCGAVYVVGVLQLQLRKHWLLWKPC
jgi:hypothetical protein